MKRALIIEDNPDNMVLITRLLQKAGYETVEAITGREGYEKALEDKPDFILLDIQLPDILGTEVLKLIRKSEIGNSIPVIAVTSFAVLVGIHRLDMEKFAHGGYPPGIQFLRFSSKMQQQQDLLD